MSCSSAPAHGRAGGFSLVELMVALLIGLIVVAGVMSAMLADRQSYRASDALSQMQDGVRTAFELMARDLRQAGGTPCGNDSDDVVSVLEEDQDDGDDYWWQNWMGLYGYADSEDADAVTTGTAEGNRVEDTPAMRVIGSTFLPVVVKSLDSPTFTLNTTSDDIAKGDILIVCDPEKAGIFQVTSYESASKAVSYSTSSSLSPGNSSTSFDSHTFGANASLAKLSASLWYIGYNGRADDGDVETSLYRLSLDDDSEPEEIVPGVTKMTIAYRKSGEDDFNEADEISSWTSVNAVKITLTISSNTQNVSTDTGSDDGRLTLPDLSYVVTLMSRVQ